MLEFARHIAQALKVQRFDDALQGYADWYALDPAYFTTGDVRRDEVRTHIHNAANLARKALYDRVSHLSHVSPRIAQALQYFFGLAAKQFQHALQQPAFFYIPDLPAKPFYEVDDIPGLAGLVSQLAQFSTELTALAEHSLEQYVDTSGPVPNTDDWQRIKARWLSTHLLRGDEPFVLADPRLAELQQLLTDPIVAHCPPHAAEAFVSTLLPQAEIPAHYGLSNLKLTVHLPLQVNAASCLTVGGEQRCWDAGTSVLIFDDSFLHSAFNHDATRRDVFIFDIWHPALSLAERDAVRDFMAQHRLWSAAYGSLAGLDARLLTP